jgi:BirA family biotin operon repressor/biotin-[acetyl-CoA-carboxylase] ligase
MASQGVKELPLLIWANKQTQGRGRNGNLWWSDEGSLTFTLVLDPIAHGLSPDQEPRLALTAAVATIEAIGILGLANVGIGIRWPNDIEVNGRKLAGILPERVDTKFGHRLLIGVGVNVLSQLEQAPLEIQRVATSLSTLGPELLNCSFIARFLAATLERFEDALRRLVVDDPRLVAEWNRLNLLRDQIVRVVLGPKTVSGRVQGIDTQGALILHDGQQQRHLLGGQVLRSTDFDTH